MFEIIARTVIVKDEKILLCKLKEHDYWFLPGGHIEHGELAVTALKRELMEEIKAAATGITLIGMFENLYEDVQEYNFVFTCEIDNSPAVAVEDHMEYSWLPLDDLKAINFRPAGLKPLILDWLQNKNFFHNI